MTTEMYAKAGVPLRSLSLRAPGDPLPVSYVSNRVRVGLHARNDTDFTEMDYRIIREAKIETLKMMSQTRVDVYRRLRQENPNLEFIVRLYDDRMGTNRKHPSPAQFAERFVPIMNALRPYATKFEIHNEPNHEEFYEGWGPTMNDARDFNTWFLEVLRGLKAACPWAQLGFPGLALHHGGWRGDLPWLQGCAESVRRADWLGVHCYWQYGNHMSLDWGLYFMEYHKLFPDKKMEITEFGDSTPNLDPNVMAAQYAQYYRVLQPFGFYVRSASAFLATSPDPKWSSFCWGNPAASQANPVVPSVGGIQRTQTVSEGPIDRLTGVKDWRGLLPTRDRSLPYDKRDVKGITYIVIHHSAQSPSWTANAGGAGHGLAGWDVTQRDRDPYPEITYHFVVDADGTIERCHSLDVLSWHAGARGMPAPGGVGINNWKGVAICLPGNFVGAGTPPDAQLQSTARLCQAILQIIPTARIVGHKDIVPPGGTQCPGDTWAPPSGAGFRDRLLSLVGSVPVEPPPALDYAYTITHQTPQELQSGATVAVPVTLRNTGSRTWTTSTFRLSYHWADSGGSMAVYDGERSSFPADVSPGQEVRLQAIVKAPSAPGNYTLQWDMVEEGVTWFSQRGVAVTPVSLAVKAPVSVPQVPTAPKATASVASSDAVKALDGDPATAWSTAIPQAHGQWFMVDLGSLQVISGIKVQSPVDNFPRGYTLSVSADGNTWYKMAIETNNKGDIDLSFPETRARYLRLDLLLQPWAITAITVRATPVSTWQATASHSAAAAAKAIDRDQSTSWSTGTAQVPGMWFQIDLGGPQRVRRLALDGPKDESPRGYRASVSVDGQNWREVAAKPLNYSPLDLTLGLPLARYLRIETTAADSSNRPWIISEVQVETAPAWTVSASHGNDRASLAVNGDAATAWTCGTPQTPGMWFQIDLGQALTVGRVVLESPEQDFPRGLAVSVSADGQNWTEAGRVARFYAGPAEVSFPPSQARYLRLEQTSDIVQVRRWNILWSISEIGVFPA